MNWRRVGGSRILTPLMSLKQDLQFTVELARGAAKIVLGQYGKVARLTKTHAATSAEAVTEADRASQRYIVSGLKRRFPTTESSAKKAKPARPSLSIVPIRKAAYG